MISILRFLALITLGSGRVLSLPVEDDQTIFNPTLSSFQSSTVYEEGANTPIKGHINRTLPSGREYVLFVPEGYDHNVQHPLVLSFHGAGGNSSRQEILSQLTLPEHRIDDRPFLSAFPQGVNNDIWGMKHIWRGAPYANQSVDDVQFVKDILHDISRNYTLDPTRYYATGKSNGGGFTSLLACLPDTSSIFAAFGIISPALYQEALSFAGCFPSRAVPILHSHGVEDDDTPFLGRSRSENWEFGPEPRVDNWRKRWALRNGHEGTTKGVLPEPNEVYYPHTNTTEERWTLGKADVIALSVGGLGHSWPSTLGLDLAGRPNHIANFNLTSAHLLPFFSKNKLPKEFLDKY
ncbi:hypothetical protein I302_102404 [Kwoniella bestiolae CBS 10118]|uniref:feruloyl esterase n=1 Tax=Kwoniella bestiolae CBS 10118 TaxID=1296100 RepID=A0A1B9GEX3_9TREE|nr:hypothetical protein I302_01095 [Kwoniella bestiolae CBS 10118]OCF29587.1 hypothetical protein I302_01095 [Kwoniella bestiolae CBS 10118]